MPYSYADYQQVSREGITSIDESGADFSADGVVIPVIIPNDQIAELLANYDPTSSTSPTVTYSRPLARCILDALKRYIESTP